MSDESRRRAAKVYRFVANPREGKAKEKKGKYHPLIAGDLGGLGDFSRRVDCRSFVAFLTFTPAKS